MMHWKKTAFVVTTIAWVPAAWASITFGQAGDRTVCPDPTFDACYIGVDGSRTATVDSASSSSFSFIGLGVQSSELPAVTFPGMPPSGPTTPNGFLEVAANASLGVTGTFNAARPYDAALIVGLGNNSTGTLFVNGGQVTTPVLVIGETDSRVSSGSVILANSQPNPVSSITVTFDSSSNGPLPGFTAIQIGRGIGSTGDLNLGFGDTVTASAGSVSIGRGGNGSLEVGTAATFSTAGSIYASTADTHGTSTISVAGALNLGTQGHLLVGIAVDPSTTGLNQGFLRQTDPGGDQHGTSVLTLMNGIVNGSVVLGTGGRIQGNGTVGGDLSNFGGTVSPGFSPGRIEVDGNFVMDGGTYLVQIAGNGPGQTDFLDVHGSADVSDATIVFQFIDGFAPTAGFTFDFLDALNGLTTSNLTFDVEGLEPGFQFSTSSANGDFSLTALTDAVAVPEPDALGLVAIGAVGIVVARRRRRVSIAT